MLECVARLMIILHIVYNRATYSTVRRMLAALNIVGQFSMVHCIAGTATFQSLCIAFVYIHMYIHTCLYLKTARRNTLRVRTVRTAQSASQYIANSAQSLGLVCSLHYSTLRSPHSPRQYTAKSAQSGRLIPTNVWAVEKRQTSALWLGKFRR
jgi:hypothetical protein